MSDTDSESNDAESFDKYLGIAEDDPKDASDDDSASSEAPSGAVELRGAIDDLIDQWFPPAKVDELNILLDRLTEISTRFEKSDPLVCVPLSEVKQANAVMIAESDDDNGASDSSECSWDSRCDSDDKYFDSTHPWEACEEFIAKLYEDEYFDSELLVQDVIRNYVRECVKNKHYKVQSSPKEVELYERLKFLIDQVPRKSYKEWCDDDPLVRVQKFLDAEIDRGARVCHTGLFGLDFDDFQYIVDDLHNEAWPEEQ